jgi:hypothetical protein
MQLLLYFNFKQSQITPRNSSIYEVKDTAQEERTTPSTITGNYLQIKFCKY